MIEIRVENKNIERFLDEVKTNLKKHKFKLVLAIENLKIGKNSVSGYFDEINRELVISINDKDWLSVLVHEYCHYLQFMEQDKTYMNLVENDVINHLNNIWDWLDGDYEFESTKEKNKSFDKVIKMELDCEKRTIKKILEYDLPIDLKNYEETAHIYLYYYLFAKKYKKWLSEYYSFADNKLFDDIPNKTLKSEFKYLPKSYEERFKKFS